MKDFIPYNEALELKELGFDEPCFTWYWDDIGMYNGLELGNHNKHINYVSAPLFSQAFRFFREKYTLDIHIRGTYFRASWVIGIPKETITKSIDGYKLVTNWEYIIHDGLAVLTYEEAELACLRRLIEIAKAKQTVEDYYANGLKESEYEGD